MKIIIKYMQFLFIIFSVALLSCISESDNKDNKEDVIDNPASEKLDSSVYTGPPRLVKVEAANLEDGKVKLFIHVEGKGIESGSFFIRLDEGTPPTSGEFYKNSNGYWYLNGGSKDKPTPNILDGSILDQSNRKGVFSHTFNTSGWPDSLYTFSCGWHNRPNSGVYKSLIGQIVLLNGKPHTAEQSNIPGISHSVIYMESGKYAAFPELFIIDNANTIGASFSARTHSRDHIDPRSEGHSLISNDGGVTWSNSTTPLIDTSWKTKSSKLVMPRAQGWIYVDVSQEEELKRQQRIVRASTDGRTAYLGGASYRYSLDNGKTWQNRELTIPNDCSGLMNHHSSASYITTSSGTLIRAIYGRRKNNANNVGKDEVYFIRSTDDGNNWSVYPMFENGVSGLEVTGFNETTLLEAKEGILIVLMRSIPEGNLWQSESKDDGLTWSTPIKTPMEGYPASAIKLKDGRLFCAYGRRKAPMGVRATLSNDNGKTWNIGKELIIRADGLGNPSDVGYPVVYELPNSSIFCLYYITTDNVNTHIASSTFKIPYK